MNSLLHSGLWENVLVLESCVARIFAELPATCVDTPSKLMAEYYLKIGYDLAVRKHPFISFDAPQPV